MATFPNLLTPLTPAGLMDVGLKDSPYDLSKLYDATTRTAAVPKAKPAAGDKEDDFKLTGLQGARTATYNAIQANEAKLASLYSTFGEQAATLPQAAEITGQIKRLKSNYQYEGLALDKEQHKSMRDAVDKSEAGDYANLTAFKESGGSVILSNNEILDQQQNEYTTNVGSNNRRYGWNATTAKEQDANDAVAKIFEPAEQMLIEKGGSGSDAKNYGDVYGVRTYHSKGGDNHTAVDQAAMQVYEQAGFKLVPKLDKNGNQAVDQNKKPILEPARDKDGNAVLDMGIALSESAPMAGYMVSFLSSIKGDKSYYNKDGSLKQDKFANDYADFVERRVSQEWNKRLQKYKDQTQTFSESNEMTARMGAEKKMVVEFQQPGIGLTAVIEGKGKAWTENSLIQGNGIPNLLGAGYIEDNTAMRVLSGKGTPEETAKFLNSNKSDYILDMMSDLGEGKGKPMYMPGVSWEMAQKAHNKVIIDKGVQFGILEKTLDDNGNVAYVPNANSDTNIKLILDKNSGKLANDPTKLTVNEENTLATMATRAEQAKGAVNLMEALLPAKSTNTSYFDNVVTINKPTPEFAAYVREELTKEGNNSATSFFGTGANISINKGLPTKLDFSGIDARVVNIDNNQALFPHVQASNFKIAGSEPGITADGFWEYSQRDKKWNPAPRRYDQMGGAMKLIEPGSREYKFNEQQKINNPGNISGGNTAAVYDITFEMTEEEYKRAKKQNKTMVVSDAVVPANKERLQLEYDKIMKDPNLPKQQLRVSGAKMPMETTKNFPYIKKDKNVILKYGLTEDQAKKAAAISDAKERTQYVATIRINGFGAGNLTSGAKPQSQQVNWEGDPDFDIDVPGDNKRVARTTKNGQPIIQVRVPIIMNQYIQAKAGQLTAGKQMVQGIQSFDPFSKNNQEVKGQQTGRLQNTTQPNNNVSGFSR